MQQIAMLEVALEIGIQPFADDRQIEATAVERHHCLDTVERRVEGHIAHAAADKLDRPVVGPVDPDDTDRAIERGLDVEVGAHLDAPVLQSEHEKSPWSVSL